MMKYLGFLFLLLLSHAALSQDMAAVEAKLKPLLANIQKDWLQFQQSQEDTVIASVIFKCTISSNGNVEKFEFVKNENLSPEFSAILQSEVTKLNFNGVANGPFYFDYNFYLYYYPTHRTVSGPDMTVVGAKLKPILARIQLDWLKAHQGRSDTVIATVEFKCTLNQNGNVEKFDFIKNSNLRREFSERLATEVSNLNFNDAAKGSFYFNYGFELLYYPARSWRFNWTYAIITGGAILAASLIANAL